MPYVLSIEARASCEHHFDSVDQAITFYDRLVRDENRDAIFRVTLRSSRQGTHVDLYPGMTPQSATLELETVWEWAPDDRLKIRPVLKERYRTKP